MTITVYMDEHRPTCTLPQCRGVIADVWVDPGEAAVWSGHPDRWSPACPGAVEVLDVEQCGAETCIGPMRADAIERAAMTAAREGRRQTEAAWTGGDHE